MSKIKISHIIVSRAAKTKLETSFTEFTKAGLGNSKHSNHPLNVSIATVTFS
jgi:hypothetical protein